jgi:hypothetical protein
VNDPRCRMVHHDVQCRNQAAGFMIVGDQRWSICEDDWLDCGIQHDIPDPLAAHMIGDMGWEPLLPDPVRVAIDRRLVALAAGAFG